MRFTEVYKRSISSHVDAAGFFKIAREYDCKKSSVQDLEREYKKTGKFETKPIRGVTSEILVILWMEPYSVQLLAD